MQLRAVVHAPAEEAHTDRTDHYVFHAAVKGMIIGIPLGVLFGAIVVATAQLLTPGFVLTVNGLLAGAYGGSMAGVFFGAVVGVARSCHVLYESSPSIPDEVREAPARTAA